MRTSKIRVFLGLLFATLLVTALIIRFLPYWADIFQVRVLGLRMDTAKQKARVIGALIGKERRFDAVQVYVWGKDGILLVLSGTVSNETDLSDLRSLVATNYVTTQVKWSVTNSSYRPDPSRL
jgi:hypothetical protein